MRVDRGLLLGRCALVALAASLGAGAAHGEGIFGTLQLQYQKVDDQIVLVSGNNSLRTLRNKQELWLRTLDLHHQDYLRPNLLFESNLRVSEQSYLDRPDLTRTPTGTLRLIHPYLQVLASHQPALTRSSLSSLSGLNRDSVTSRMVTSRNQESMVASHVSAPNWPRVDVSWIQRRRDGGASVGDRNNSRNARVTFDRDRYSLYGGVNEQRMSSNAVNATASRQQVWTLGGTGHYAPVSALSLGAQYDFSNVRGVAAGARRPSTMSQSALLTGDWRAGPRWTANTNYQWRRVDFGTPNLRPQTDQEGALLGRFLYSRRANVLASVGFRTLREALSGGANADGIQRYATGMASFDSRVRRKWTMNSSVVHTTSWDPGRPVYHVQTASGSTRGTVHRRIQADANVQYSRNSDTASVATRYTSAWSARIQGTPLRTLQMGLALRNQRNGPGLFRASAVTRGLVLDMTWRPLRMLQVVGQYGGSVALPSISGRTTTRSLSARFEPTSHWQWYGSWTRSDQTVFVSSAGQLSSREVLSGRLQYAPNRRLASSAGVSYNEPGRAQESRRLDLALTWSFGR